jgi:hypothetical protein
VEKTDLSDIFAHNLFPQEKEKSGTEFFWWAYDDGTEAGAAIDVKSKKEICSKIFKNKEERIKFQQTIKAKNKKKFEFEKNKLMLKSGLPQFDLRANGIILKWQKAEIAKNGREHLFRMLEACGQDFKARAEVIKLISSLLSAYYFGYLTFNNIFSLAQPLKILCAPILACNVRDGAAETLESMVASVAVDTTEPFYGEMEYGKLFYNQPNCLPQNLKDRHTIDCAYIRLGKSKKKCFETLYPAQYRDTSAFINARFFAGNDLFQFQQRNPWASLVFYGISDSRLVVEPIRLDGKIFAKFVNGETWDVEAVHKLILYFVNWLHKNFKKGKLFPRLKAKLIFYDRLIEKHNRRRGSAKIRGLHKAWMEMQLLAVKDFSDFGTEFGCWTAEEGEQLTAEWTNLLLPDCCPYPQSAVMPEVHRVTIFPEHDCVTLFEKTLEAILNDKMNWKHFIYVPPKTDFLTEKAGAEIWGYIRDYQDRKAHQSIVTLQIREEIMRRLAKNFCPAECDWYDVIKYLRKKDLNYLHQSKTVRMPGIGEEEKTLILKVSQLDFLSDEAKSIFDAYICV